MRSQGTHPLWHRARQVQGIHLISAEIDEAIDHHRCGDNAVCGVKDPRTDPEAVSSA